MKHDLEEALDQSLFWLREGLDLEACLARYPAYARQLRPLLELALDLKQVRTPEPSAAARAAGEERILATLTRASSRRPGRGPLVPLGLVAPLVPPFKPVFPRLAWQWLAVLTLLILAAIGTASVSASAGSLPGDALYPVKLAVEKVHLSLTFDEAGRQALQEEFDAQQRQDVQTVLHAGRKATVEFKGELIDMVGGVWQVDGLATTLEVGTAIHGQPHPGAAIRVRAYLPGDGSVVATELEVESEPEDKHAAPTPTATVRPTSADDEDLEPRAPSSRPTQESRVAATARPVEIGDDEDGANIAPTSLVLESPATPTAQPRCDDEEPDECEAPAQATPEPPQVGSPQPQCGEQDECDVHAREAHEGTQTPTPQPECDDGEHDECSAPPSTATGEPSPPPTPEPTEYDD